MGEFLILTPASIDASLVVTVVRPLFQTNAFHDPFPTNLIENKQNYSTVSSSLSSFKTKKKYIYTYIYILYLLLSFLLPSPLPSSTFHQLLLWIPAGSIPFLRICGRDSHYVEIAGFLRRVIFRFSRLILAGWIHPISPVQRQIWGNDKERSHCS